MKGQASDPQALPLHTSHDMALPTLGSPQGSGYHYPYLQPQSGGLDGGDVYVGGRCWASWGCEGAEGSSLGELNIPSSPLPHLGRHRPRPCIPACTLLLPTQLSAERGVALPGAGKHSGEKQQGDQRQQDGQHQHHSCRTADRTGHEGPRRLGGGQLRKSSPVLWSPGQKRESSFPFPVPLQFLKEELEKLPLGYRERALSLTGGGTS